MKVIYTPNAPAAIGPYSQAKVVNGMVFASGQIPIVPATGEIAEGDITVQAEQVMKNLDAVLTEAGTSFANAVKTTCFLADMGWQISAHSTRCMRNTSPGSPRVPAWRSRRSQRTSCAK